LKHFSSTILTHQYLFKKGTFANPILGGILEKLDQSQLIEIKSQKKTWVFLMIFQK